MPLLFIYVRTCGEEEVDRRLVTEQDSPGKHRPAAIHGIRIRVVCQKGSHIGNPAELSFLSLGGLAPGSNVRIGSLLIGLLESWDSTDGGCCTPDYLDIFINGSLVASLTTNNALGTVKSYSGATELFYREQLNANTYYSDTLLDLSTATFANTAADGLGNWSIGFQARGVGWQGGSDEAWGLDNLKIYGTLATGAVPEPATWALLILGFGAVGGAMRKRSQVAFA